MRQRLSSSSPSRTRLLASACTALALALLPATGQSQNVMNLLNSLGGGGSNNSSGAAGLLGAVTGGGNAAAQGGGVGLCRRDVGRNRRRTIQTLQPQQMAAVIDDRDGHGPVVLECFGFGGSGHLLDIFCFEEWPGFHE